MGRPWLGGLGCMEGDRCNMFLPSSLCFLFSCPLLWLHGDGSTKEESDSANNTHLMFFLFFFHYFPPLCL